MWWGQQRLYLCSTHCFGINYINIYIIYKYNNFIHELFVLQNSRVLHKTWETELLKGHSNPHQTANWNLWQGHHDTSFTIQKHVTICNVNADGHCISLFTKRPLFKEEPCGRRISGNEPTEIWTLLLDVLILKLSCKIRKYVGIAGKVCLRGPEQAVSIQGQAVSGHVQSVPSPTTTFQYCREHWVSHVPWSPWWQTQQPQSSRVLPHVQFGDVYSLPLLEGHVFKLLLELD